MMSIWWEIISENIKVFRKIYCSHYLWSLSYNFSSYGQLWLKWIFKWNCLVQCANRLISIDLSKRIVWRVRFVVLFAASEHWDQTTIHHVYECYNGVWKIYMCPGDDTTKLSYNYRYEYANAASKEIYHYRFCSYEPKFKDTCFKR